MNRFATNVISFCLAGLFALPVGFCCGTGEAGSQPSAHVSSCCQQNAQPQTPVNSTTCCCAETRAAVVSAEKTARPGDAAGAPVWLAAPPTVDLPAATTQRPFPLFSSGEHAFQTLYCVWRC